MSAPLTNRRIGSGRRRRLGVVVVHGGDRTGPSRASPGASACRGGVRVPYAAHSADTEGGAAGVKGRARGPPTSSDVIVGNYGFTVQ